MFEASHDGRHEGILPKKHNFNSLDLLSSRDSYNYS
jgi:hypothetical protein